MEASKITIGEKTYDLNYLTRRRKSDLRRKLIIEYIQNKPAGTIIRVSEFEKEGRFATRQNAEAFVKRMVRDGVIMRYDGDRPRTYYYAVTGSIRQRKPADTPAENQLTVEPKTDRVIALAKELRNLGVKFTITITNEDK